MQKFLFITNRYYPDFVGGAEITVQTLVQELHRGGKDVVVVALSSATEETKDTVNGVPVYRVVVRNIYPFGSVQPPIKKLLWHVRDLHNTDAGEVVGRILDAEQPNLVSTHNLGGLGVAVWGQVRRRGIRLIHTLHDYYLLCPRVTMFSGGKIALRNARYALLFRSLSAERAARSTS